MPENEHDQDVEATEAAQPEAKTSEAEADEDVIVLPSGEKIVRRPIEDELRESFLDYSMSVIVSRALPDVRDGLKPVQRRILYAMLEAGLVPGQPFRKSATVVGEVLGKYHPHGDSSVYEAMVHLAQSFSMAEPLVDGQGNFGSIDGDPAAAYRYTEARLTHAAMQLLADIDKDCVDWAPNFDDTRKEPVVLPGRLPNLLLNGSQGIAVGMATNIPPHNLREIAEAVDLLCENEATPEDEIVACVRGPDFPTGARVMDTAEARAFYRTGRGRFVIRARCHLERSNGRPSLLFTEIPFNANKTTIIEKIAELHRERKIAGIADLRDESDRTGLAIRVELKRDADPRAVLRTLYKKTQLEATFGAQMLALVHGRPETLSLRQALVHFIEHRLEIIVRRSEFDLAQAREKAHIVEGLLVAIDAIDQVVQIIRSSRNSASAKTKLMKELDLTDRQAQAILDLRLARLTALDVSKLKQDLEALQKTIARLVALLADPAAQRRLVRDETREMAERFGRDRRTSMVSPAEADDVDQQAASEIVRVMISASGLVRQEPVGSKPRPFAATEGDPLIYTLALPLADRLVVLGTSGQYYPLDISAVPGPGSRAKPLSAVVVGWGETERPLWVGTPGDLEAPETFVVSVSRQGQIKKTSTGEYGSLRAGGITGAVVREDDALVSTFVAHATDHVLLVSRNGQGIRFALVDVPDQGRAARGVRGLNLKADDVVVAGGVLRDEALIVTERGIAKRIPESDFPVQGRAGQGVKLFSDAAKAGKIVFARTAVPESAPIWVAAPGETIEFTRFECADARISSRPTLGDMLTGWSKGTAVAGVAMDLVDARRPVAAPAVADSPASSSEEKGGALPDLFETGGDAEGGEDTVEADSEAAAE